MGETGGTDTPKTKRRWIIPLIVMAAVVAAAWAYLHFHPIGGRTVEEKKITVKELNILTFQSAGKMSLEPFIVVCKTGKGKNPRILIAEMTLSFSEPKRQDVLTNMYDIRSAILDRLQKDGASMDKARVESSLNSDLGRYLVERVSITRFDLR